MAWEWTKISSSSIREMTFLSMSSSSSHNKDEERNKNIKKGKRAHMCMKKLALTRLREEEIVLDYSISKLKRGFVIATKNKYQESR
ncbi:hypothetical protein MTR_1g101283 [Medicago truncatula]|uniref:Uncharacterized protein n=1 Tax=Medicago truncatula TaxID=3880 RepID=A0A072VPK8_MEDTR|nr:hypothetical protein MTR_1g101283 [Medicago truncatula]